MNFSIITCSHNPNIEIFNRLLFGINSLQVNSTICFEWIIVDNNSTIPIQNQFLFDNAYTKVVSETKPGLTAARIAGAKIANGDWLIFFDDDNEPKDNFILELYKGIQKYPNVNCWGPGQISVQFIGGEVSDWFNNNKVYFQERREVTAFGSEKHMQSYYPIGTGLCIQSDAMKDYMRKVDTGTYSVTDRTGSSLVSGGDTQIVLNNQLLGNTGGKLEHLSLNHLIEARKANFKYLIKQKYWTASSYLLVLKQVYNDFKIEDKDRNYTFKDVKNLIKQYYFQIKVKKQNPRNAYLTVCSYLGAYNARIIAGYSKKNKLFSIVEKIMIG